MAEDNFKDKLNKFLVGKQTLRSRLSTAFWPAFILSFILFLFGPLDLAYIAESYVDFTLLEILGYAVLIWLVVFAVMFLICWIPGGRLHAWISSFYCGLGLAFYIQGGYLNTDLGTQGGKGVVWTKYSGSALVNLAVFVLIMLIPFLVHFFSRKLWRHFVIYIPILLFIMQLIPLGITVYHSYTDNLKYQDHYIVLKDKEYVLGQENIVVFILDETGPEAMEKMLAKYPDALDDLRDFEYFDNFNTEYVGTFPAAAYLLTHTAYDPDKHPDDYFAEAWHSDDANSFYGQMKEDGWEVRLFHISKYGSGMRDNEYGLISNIEKIDSLPSFTIDPVVYRRLIDLSFYRYFPLIMKAPFWIYTADLNRMKNLPENEQTWNKLDSLMKFMEQGLKAEDTGKVYVTYHYRGSHWPFVINQDGILSDKMVGVEDQLAGHFHMISEYLKQMKELGIYDSSSIIITADHGNFDYPHSIFIIKPAGTHREKMTYSHAPVSQSDFMATIAELAGLKERNYGPSVFEIPENEERLRCSAQRWMDPDYPQTRGKVTNAMKEYCYIGDSDTLREMIENGDFTSYPLPYPFY